MLSLSELVRIYVCLTPTDMRKSFVSLAAVVREGLGYDPLSGHLFVFRSRRGDRVKLLWWDRDGLTLLEHQMPHPDSYYPDLSLIFPAAARMQRAAFDLVGIASDADDQRPWAWMAAKPSA